MLRIRFSLGIAVTLTLVFASCQPAGEGKKKPSDSVHAPEDGIPMTVAIPLTTEQAAAMTAVQEDAVLDVYINGELSAEGIRGGVRGASPGGIRSGSPGIRGGPRRTSHELLFSFEASFLLPKTLATEGSYSLDSRVRSTTNPSVVYVQVQTSVEIRASSSGAAVEVVSKDLNLNEVKMPDLDGDGVATLQEVIVAGVNSALDPASKPTEQQIEQSLAQLGAKLEQILKEQGISGKVAITPISGSAPDTNATCPPSPTLLKTTLIEFSSSKTSSSFLCQLDAASALPCTSPFSTGTLVDGPHSLSVRAKDASGNVDPTPAVCNWTVKSPPAEPTGLTVTTGDGSVTLSWREVSGAVSYKIYYGTASGNFTTSLTSTTAGVSVSGLNNGTQYYFVVASADIDGVEGAKSGEVSATPTTPAATPPPPPLPGPTQPSSPPPTSPPPADTTPPTFSDLTSAVAVSASQINLLWTAATDNVSASSTIVYEICQSTNPAGCTLAFSATLTTAAGATSRNVTGLTSGTRYYFVVRARDQAGNKDANITQRSAVTLSKRIAQAVSAGNKNSCALVSDGSVFCWGDNGSGQLGDGTAGAWSGTPVAVSSLTNVISILSGVSYACANLADGIVKCWGDNDNGELGDGTTTNRSLPTTVPSLSNVTSLTTGANHTCALTSEGAVKCWGQNTFGQIGDGTSLSKTVPVGVSTISGAGSISAGISHSCAILSNGEARCWGTNSYGELGNGTISGNQLTAVTVTSLTGAVSIAAGGNNTCALVSDGAVKCWGDNFYGQLGDGTTANKSTPVAVSTLTQAVAVTTASAFFHSCALRADGSVWCWGRNDFGQLGDGTTINRSTPVAVSVLTGAVAASAGDYHTCALLSDGSAKCWGSNGGCALGDGCSANSTTPVSVLLPARLLAAVSPNLHESMGQGASVRPWREHLTAGYDHTCALISDGTVRCWGSNGSGQLGNGTNSASTAPVIVTGLTDVLAVTAGGGIGHTCALISGGTVKCWGDGIYGQLGDGMNANRSTAANVLGLSAIVAIAAGSNHVCALVADGTVKCWGAGSSGELGDGTTAGRTTPVTVSTLTGATGLSGGYGYSCAILSDGKAMCWGSNVNGQLGDGTTVGKTTPIAVSTVSGAIGIAGGFYFACALVSDGTVKCWGANGSGQLGDGTTIDKPSPVVVSLLTGAVALSAGAAFACALLSDGTVKCWGRNNLGQLGDGTVADKSTPVAVSTLTGGVAVAGGSSHTCSLLSNGTAKCWGHNVNGQLGDGTTVNWLTPMPVVNLP